MTARMTMAGAASSRAVLVPVVTDGLDAPVLDCYENNLQVLARQAGAADVSTPFARDWAFRPEDGDTPPRFARQPIEERLREDTGLILTWHGVPPEVPPIEACARLLVGGRPVLAVADAYHMDWLPYAGNTHMTHSFIVNGVDAARGQASIVDAYHNDTAWGPARPAITTLSRAALAGLLGGGARLGTLEPGPPGPPLNVQATLSANSREITRAMAGGDFQRYVADRRDRADQPGAIASVALACWLGERSRTRYARWLGQVAEALALPPLADLAVWFTDDVAANWRRASELAYLAQQRVQRGRRAPGAVFDTLAGPVADAESAAAARHLAIADAWSRLRPPSPVHGGQPEMLGPPGGLLRIEI